MAKESDVEVQRSGVRLPWAAVWLLLVAMMGGLATAISYTVKASMAATTIADDLRHLTAAVERLEARADARLQGVEERVVEHGNRLTAIEARERWGATSAASRTAPAPP